MDSEVEPVNEYTFSDAYKSDVEFILRPVEARKQ
jgi:hypothetical protein